VAIDAGSMWVGVLLTGALAGPAQAGIFAAAGRYALAGLLVMHGLRVAVAPQLSRLLGAGNVGVGLAQTVLLMSGNSRGHLCATVAGLTLTLALGCALIPDHGALGAAVAWSAGIVTENALAACLARRVLGQPPADRGLLIAGAAVLLGVGTPCSVGVAVSGQGLVGLAVAVAVLAAVVLLLLGDARIRAALHDVRQQVRR
jgi:O-antigen/teichoic acid export membrane protein